MEVHSRLPHNPLPSSYPLSPGILVSGGPTNAKFGAARRVTNVSYSSSTLNSCNYVPSTNFARSTPTIFSRMAVGSNVSEEDTDDMFDDLVKKYGKVVYSRNDQKPASEEVDDDAESLSLAVAMAKVASDVKAADIKIDAIRTKIRDMAEVQYGRVSTGDSKPNSWTLLDFGDIVVHIFLPPQREYYNLEEFYANATSIELPFENQQSPGSKGY